MDSEKGRVDRSKDDTIYRHSDHPNIGNTYMSSPGADRQEFLWHKILHEIVGGKVSRAEGYRMGKNWAEMNWDM